MKLIRNTMRGTQPTERSTAPISPAEEKAIAAYGELYRQIRKLYGDTIYNHKIQEKQADLLTNTFHWLSLANQILAGLTTGSLVIAVFYGSKIETILGSLLGTANFVITLRLQAVNFPKLASNHGKAAQNIWPVRERLRSLLTDMQDEILTPDEVREAREEILHDLDTIYADAPRTSLKAFQAAQAALKASEHTYVGDELRDLTS